MNLPKMYSEVCAVLTVLGSEYINKIPTKIYKYMLSQKDNNIQISYNVNKIIDEQEISKEALMFISYLNLQYWCSEEEKQELLKIYKQNDTKIEQELSEKYNVDNLFKNRQNNKTIQEIHESQETQIIEYKPKSNIKKTLEKIINAICFWRK